MKEVEEREGEAEAGTDFFLNGTLLMSDFTITDFNSVVLIYWHLAFFICTVGENECACVHICVHVHGE